MKRQRATTQMAHCDDFSKALIGSSVKYLGEEGIPSLQKKGNEDDFSKKDPKAKAAPADPAVNLATGSGPKQSHGAEIKYTNVVKKEEVESEENTIEEAKNKKGKEQGADGKACWKGYKYAGTENGKDKCVKMKEEKEEKEKVSLQDIVEKAVSKSQQRFMGMVHAKKKGEMKDGSEKLEKAAASLTGKEAKKFASTKHKGLPEKKAQKEEFELAEKKLDPVGKEDKDIDNDGDHDSTDKYLTKRRKAITKAVKNEGNIWQQAKGEVEEVEEGMLDNLKAKLKKARDDVKNFHKTDAAQKVRDQQKKRIEKGRELASAPNLAKRLNQSNEENEPTKANGGIAHDCATHVAHEEYGLGSCVSGEHTLHEDGTVTHYDVIFERVGLKRDVPVNELKITASEKHLHASKKKDIEK